MFKLTKGRREDVRSINAVSGVDALPPPRKRPTQPRQSYRLLRSSGKRKLDRVAGSRRGTDSTAASTRSHFRCCQARHMIRTHSAMRSTQEGSRMESKDNRVVRRRAYTKGTVYLLICALCECLTQDLWRIRIGQMAPKQQFVFARWRWFGKLTKIGENRRGKSKKKWGRK